MDWQIILRCCNQLDLEHGSIYVWTDPILHFVLVVFVSGFLLLYVSYLRQAKSFMMIRKKGMGRLCHIC